MYFYASTLDIIFLTSSGGKNSRYYNNGVHFALRPLLKFFVLVYLLTDTCTCTYRVPPPDYRSGLGLFEGVPCNKIEYKILPSRC